MFGEEATSLKIPSQPRKIWPMSAQLASLTNTSAIHCKTRRAIRIPFPTDLSDWSRQKDGLFKARMEMDKYTFNALQIRQSIPS
jgi:hypothetical protein